MKKFVSILLFTITALYVLPVNDGFWGDAERSSKCVDKNTDDNKDAKEDNFKEFIPTDLISTFPKNYTAMVAILPLLSVFPVHFTIETPPPDQA